MEFQPLKVTSGAVGIALTIVLTLVSLVSVLSRNGQATNNNTQDIQELRQEIRQVKESMATKDDVNQIRQDLRELNKAVRRSK